MKRWIRTLIRFSLDRKGLILALAVLLMIFGLYTYTRIRYDVFPEFSPPQVSIQTEAPGFAPEQVELLVTQPIEQAINGTVGLATLRSTSIQGLSVIVATFSPTSDIFRDRQLIAERLSGLTTHLPLNVTPVMTPLTSSTGRILTIGLTSNIMPLMALRTLSDWTIKPSLLSIPGVANVTIFSQDVKQYQVQIDPARLIQYHLSLSDIIQAVQKATGVVGAGFIENNNQRITLQTEGQADTISKLAKTVLLHAEGFSVTLGDVAEIVIGPAPPIGAATVAYQPAVHLLIDEQYGANTLAVTNAIENKLKTLLPMLQKQGIQLHPRIFSTADFIETAVHNLKISLTLGAVLVVLVLFAFLFNLRAAVISLAAIPLSLITAMMVLHYFGLGINTMTLGGLAIAIGLLVDDAVITVENIYRRLRENHHTKNPRSVSRVILNATLEVRSAVVYATLVITFVFIPVLTLPGLSGRLFAPLAIAYILATLASLIVALTVTPALSLLLLSNHALPEHEPPLVNWLKTRYVTTLEKVEHHSQNLIILIVIITLAALASLPFLGGEFLPHLNEGSLIVHMNEAPGTSLSQSLSLGKEVIRTLSQLPYVTSIAQEAGRAELGTDVHGPQNNEFDVKLKPLSGSASKNAMNEIRQKLSAIPGAQFSIETPLTERIEETLSGYTAAVVVNIFGNDLAQLDRIANNA
ncbi:MAG TPA: efflux RND transporter permease subunit, partial [Candidatus Babeliales bacterium]|nr:efflux RND transporter permease subunit [Candidatus Babeliales bacterium]